MERSSLTETQLERLKECIYNSRLGDGVLFAGSALFFFDYILTFAKEVRSTCRGDHHWASPAFVICRYCALGTAVLAATPARSNAIVDSVGTVLRLTSIIASEVVLAVRTWAIWGRNKKLLYFLLAVTVCVVTPTAIIIGKALTTNQIRPLITPELTHLCSATVSDIKVAFIVPYILTISYEILTLALSLYRITKWRQSIPEDIRAPLLDTLWRDGVIYFTFMLLLSLMNIGIVLQSEAPQLRSGGGNLQAILHSMMACRIVLHLATSDNPRDITNPAISAYVADVSDIQFTTRITTHEAVERLPVSRREVDNEEPKICYRSLEIIDIHYSVSSWRVSLYVDHSGLGGKSKLETSSLVTSHHTFRGGGRRDNGLGEAVSGAVTGHGAREGKVPS
ncbi:hypothetical protein PM082_019098 [Marasmius tenuissimus]|nr:hypothetical protein PM082_019098 [Marasmius tenuissimus]